MVAPTGILSLPVDHLRRMVSESTAFQDFVGASSSAEALDSIYVVNGPENMTRPFALVGFGDKWLSELTVFTGYETRAELTLLFEDDVAPENQESDADAFYAFANQIGSIISDLMLASNADDNLSITQIEQDKDFTVSRVLPTSTDPDDYYSVGFILTWQGI